MDDSCLSSDISLLFMLNVVNTTTIIITFKKHIPTYCISYFIIIFSKIANTKQFQMGRLSWKWRVFWDSDVMHKLTGTGIRTFDCCSRSAIVTSDLIVSLAFTTEAKNFKASFIVWWILYRTILSHHKILFPRRCNFQPTFFQVNFVGEKF